MRTWRLNVLNSHKHTTVFILFLVKYWPWLQKVFHSIRLNIIYVININHFIFGINILLIWYYNVMCNICWAIVQWFKSIFSMPVCALCHFVFTISGQISVRSLLIFGRLKTECYSDYDKTFDMILKQPILVIENVPIP